MLFILLEVSVICCHTRFESQTYYTQIHTHTHTHAHAHTQIHIDSTYRVGDWGGNPHFFVLQLSGYHAAQPHWVNVFQRAGQEAPTNCRKIRIQEEQCRFHPAEEKWTSCLPRWFPWGIMGICSSSLHVSTIVSPLESCGGFCLVRGAGAVVTVCAIWSLYN